MVDDVGEWSDVSAADCACLVKMPAEQTNYGIVGDGGAPADADTRGFEAAAGDDQMGGNGAVKDGGKALSEGHVELVWGAECDAEVVGEGEGEIPR